MDRNVALLQLKAFQVPTASSLVHAAQPFSLTGTQDSKRYMPWPLHAASGRQQATPGFTGAGSNHSRERCQSSLGTRSNVDTKAPHVIPAQPRLGGAVVNIHGSSDACILKSRSTILQDARGHQPAAAPAIDRQAVSSECFQSQAASHSKQPLPTRASLGTGPPIIAMQPATSQRSEDENVPELANFALVSSKAMLAESHANRVATPAYAPLHLEEQQRQKWAVLPPNMGRQLGQIADDESQQQLSRPGEASEIAEGRLDVTKTANATGNEAHTEAAQSLEGPLPSSHPLSISQTRAKGNPAPIMFPASATPGEWQAHEMRLAALEATLLKHAQSAGNSLLLHSRERVCPAA
jgi:hypothetical protein